MLGVWGLPGWWSRDWLKPNKGKSPGPPSSSTGTCLRPLLTVGLLGVASPSASSAGLSDSTFLMFTSSLWNDPAAHSPASCLCVERAGEKGGLCSGLRAARGWCPHARPLPKMPLSCLKAGPLRAAAAPRFMGISGLACDSILTAVTHSLAHLKPSVGVPVLLNSLPKDDQHLTN